LRVNGHFSDFYQLPLSVLQGDPISPLLFVIYISALCTKDTDDPTLSGISIPELMLADDITLVSTSAHGMQRKLDKLEMFCRQRRLLLHIKDKTKSMILGKTSGTAEPPLMLCGQPLENTKEHTVNGFRISATKGSWDSRPHIANKLLAAKKVSNCLLALRKKTITATPAQNILLYQTCVEPHLTNAALLDCIQLANTAHHSWYGSFLKALTGYGIPPPTGTAPIDIADAKKRMTSSVLTTIKLRVAEMSWLSIHPDADITWIRKPYTNLEYPLAAAIASLRSSTHFLNVERLRHVDASRRVERENRRCPRCPVEVEDEKHALLVCPTFDEERVKWKNRLMKNGVNCNDEDLFKLCLNPTGKEEIILFMAIFVKAVLKKVKRRYTGG
jgi:hypothetical protein